MIKNPEKSARLTVAELAITLTLIGIVLGLGYLYFDFGSLRFNR